MHLVRQSGQTTHRLPDKKDVNEIYFPSPHTGKTTEKTYGIRLPKHYNPKTYVKL